MTEMTITGPDGQTTGPFTAATMEAATRLMEDGTDQLFLQAANLVIREGKCSTSYLQRQLGIGYNKAARLVERMEEFEIVSPADHVGKRDITADDAQREAITLAHDSQTMITRTMAAADRAGPPVKETEADTAVSDRAYGVAAGELRQFIERVERLEEEKKEIAEQIKEVMAEAKGRGYNTKILRKVISLRKRDADDIAEEEALLEMYKAALGMA